MIEEFREQVHSLLGWVQNRLNYSGLNYDEYVFLQDLEDDLMSLEDKITVYLGGEEE